MNRLTVIIPSRNEANLTPCVQAVKALDPNCKIIVVWDRSRGNHAIVSTPEYRVHYVETDFVYARSCNIGIEAAGDDDVVLLNDDALLRMPGGFSRMQETAEAHQEYGVISSATNNVGNVNQHMRGIGLREDPRMICFVAVLIPRRTIERVGLLDENFTNYGCDDDDYCVRVRRAGLKIGISDRCFVDHSTLMSTYRGRALYGDYRENLKVFANKWGPLEAARVGRF